MALLDFTLPASDPNNPNAQLLTPDMIARRQAMAAALTKQGMDYSPVQSPWQGAARMAQALVGALQTRALDKQAQAGLKAGNDLTSQIYGSALAGASGSSSPGAPARTGGDASALPAFAQAGAGGGVVKMTMPDPVSENLTPQQRGLLNAIAAPESGGAYNIRYTPRGGATFEGFDAHPGVFEPGPAGPSSAAGRYQFTKTTWDRLGGGAFTPAAQDRRALQLAEQDYKSRTGRDLNSDLQANGLTPDMLKALGPTWAGLKDNPQKALAAYQRTLSTSGGNSADMPAPGAAEAGGAPFIPPSQRPDAPQGLTPQMLQDYARRNVMQPPSMEMLPGAQQEPSSPGGPVLGDSQTADLPAPGATPAGGAPFTPPANPMLIAALLDPQRMSGRGADYTLGSRGMNGNNNGLGMTEISQGGVGPVSARTARQLGGGTPTAMTPADYVALQMQSDAPAAAPPATAAAAPPASPSNAYGALSAPPVQKAPQAPQIPSAPPARSSVPLPPARPSFPGDRVALGSAADQAFTRLEGQPNPDMAAPGALKAGPAPFATPQGDSGNGSYANPYLEGSPQAARAFGGQSGPGSIAAPSSPSAAVPTASGAPAGMSPVPAASLAPTPQNVASLQPGARVNAQAALGVLQSPFTTPQQKQLASVALQQAMKQGQYQQFTDADGSIWQKNATDGKLELVRDGSPSSVKEYKFYRDNLPAGQQPMDYGTWTVQKARAGATNISNVGNTNSQNESEKAYGQAEGKAFGEVLEAGKQARLTQGNLALMNDAFERGGDNIFTGPAAKAVLGAKQAIQNIAGIDLGGIPETEAVQKLGFGLATGLTKEISTRPTQQEFLKGLENVPGIFMSKPGSKAMMSILNQQAQAKIDLGKLVQDPKNRANWPQVEERYFRDHPLISPFSGKPLNNDDVTMLKKAASAAGVDPTTGQPVNVGTTPTPAASSKSFKNLWE